jgi:hypothetical protein
MIGQQTVVSTQELPNVGESQQAKAFVFTCNLRSACGQGYNTKNLS